MPNTRSDHDRAIKPPARSSARPLNRKRKTPYFCLTVKHGVANRENEMRVKVIKIMMVVLATVALGITGCGGGSGSSNPAPTTATGKFIDAPVAGLSYVSGNQNGVTGADGSFTYEIGKNVKFTIGDIVLGEAPAQTVMTPINLSKTPGADASTPDVVAILQFLQSISSTDPASGTITIQPATLVAAKGKSLDFTKPEGLSAIIIVLPNPRNVGLVTAETAKAHFTTVLATLNSTTTPSTNGFTTAMLSGKTFTDSNGAIRKFNSNGTFYQSTSSTTNMTWSINSNGQILVVGGSGTATVTFISGSLSTGLNYSVLNTDGTTNTGTLVPATAPTSSTTTVGDPTTYLVWQKTDDNNKRNWNEAITYCDNLTLNGYNNWRLPSRDELKALNYSSVFNQINGTYYAQVNDQYIGSYWSNTSFDNSQAYHVFLRSNAGSEGYANKSFYSNLVRCVRP